MATKTNYSSSVTANGTKLVHKKNRGDALASAGFGTDEDYGGDMI